MRDDYLTQSWTSSHYSFSNTVNAALRSIAIGLARLNRYEFDAPWRRNRRLRHPG